MPSRQLQYIPDANAFFGYEWNQDLYDKQRAIWDEPDADPTIPFPSHAGWDCQRFFGPNDDESRRSNVPAHIRARDWAHEGING